MSEGGGLAAISERLAYVGCGLGALGDAAASQPHWREIFRRFGFRTYWRRLTHPRDRNEIGCSRSRHWTAQFAPESDLSDRASGWLVS